MRWLLDYFRFVFRGRKPFCSFCGEEAGALDFCPACGEVNR